jgi:transposase
VSVGCGVNPWNLDSGWKIIQGNEYQVAQHDSSKRCPAEFKRGAVGLVRSSPERTVAEIAVEVGVSDQSLRKWVDQARIDSGGDRGGALTTAEREELCWLRCEVAELCNEKEILRKAAACFAAETTRDSLPTR